MDQNLWSGVSSFITSIQTSWKAHIVGTSLGLGAGQCGPLLEILESLTTDASLNATLILNHMRGESGIAALSLLGIWEMKFCMRSSHELESKLFVRDVWNPVTCCSCIIVSPWYRWFHWLLEFSPADATNVCEQLSIKMSKLSVAEGFKVLTVA